MPYSSRAAKRTSLSLQESLAPMRFLYLDPGLRDNVGHHANYCRYITRELRERGIEPLIFAHQRVEEALRSELGAIPYFRVSTYKQGADRGPFGWLSTFNRHSRRTLEDLSRLPDLVPSDIVYVSSALPAQLMAVVEWQAGRPEDRRPAVVVEIFESGLVVGRSETGLEVDTPDPRPGLRSELFRYAARRLAQTATEHLRFITFDETTSNLLSSLLGSAVQTLALPYRAVTALRNRAGARPITVAILGHQRANKGYHDLPEIVAALLRSRSDIRLLVQNVNPVGKPETRQALRDLADGNERLILEERPAGKVLWPQLLERSDLILLPYPPQPYVATFSSMAAEALANGIPLVVPAGTTMEGLLREYDGPGVAFDRYEVASVVAATERALDDFDRYATLAQRAALRWPQTRGPARMVDGLLSLVDRRPTGVGIPWR